MYLGAREVSSWIHLLWINYANNSAITLLQLTDIQNNKYSENLKQIKNVKGEIIEEIHKANNNACGIIINAGALTHTSIGILDALTMFDGPKIEIHITNVYAREDFRHKSFISPVATGIIAGLGVNSYVLAIEAIKELIND